MTSDVSRVLEDPVAEARRVLVAAAEADIPVRAVGGVAVGMRAPSVASMHPAREYHDIDLAGRGGTSARLDQLMRALGYTPAERFNKLNGAERLLFHDGSGRRVDVFLDRLRMCHTLDFADRLTVDPETLTVADLALSKLQIVEQTPRDGADLAALLADHEIATNDADGLNATRVAQVCGADWGWWRTVMDNLERLIAAWRDDESPVARLATERATRLRHAVEDAPKSLAWRVRDRIGRRMTWYELPEEPR